MITESWKAVNFGNSFISMSSKSPTELEVTSRIDHSCLLGSKPSNQTKITKNNVGHIHLGREISRLWGVGS